MLNKLKKINEKYKIVLFALYILIAVILAVTSMLTAITTQNVAYALPANNTIKKPEDIGLKYYDKTKVVWTDVNESTIVYDNRNNKIEGQINRWNLYVIQHYNETYHAGASTIGDGVNSPKRVYFGSSNVVSTVSQYSFQDMFTKIFGKGDPKYIANVPYYTPELPLVFEVIPVVGVNNNVPHVARVEIPSKDIDIELPNAKEDAISFGSITNNIKVGESIKNAITNIGIGSGAITYTSSDNNIASVDSSTGLVTGKGRGQVAITATKASDGAHKSAKASYTMNISRAIHPTVNFTNSNSTTFGTNLPITISGAQGNVTYSVINGSGAGTMSASTFVPTKAGQVTIRATIAESNNYLGTIKDLVVTINSFNLAQNNVTFGTIPNLTFNNVAQTPTPTITTTVGGKTVTLINGTDFSFSYLNNTNQGTATVTIIPKGNYKGTASKTFTISKFTVSNANITMGTIANQIYTGNAFKPTPTVTVNINGKNIDLNANDFTYSYTNNVIVNGTTNKPTVTITAKGNYEGTASANFNIIQSEQNFNFTSTFTSLECFNENTMTFVGSLMSTGAKTWRSSNPNVISVDQNGKLTAHKVGKVDITLTIAADNNFKVRSIKKEINATLINGFYIGNISSPESHTVYATLKEAVDAANNGETIMVRGNTTTSEVVNIINNKNIKIIGENGAKISATGTNGGILSVNGQLELQNLTLDGKNIDGNSLVNLNGVLNAYNTSFINGVSNQGGAIYVGSNSSLVIDDPSTYGQKTSFIGNSANLGGAIYIADDAAEVKILSGSMSNNHASVLGNAIFTDNGTFELDGTDKTVGITDSIGIGSTGSIKVINGITHKVSVNFADPTNQLSETKKYIFSDNIEGALLKEYFRVVNSGYTFDGEKVDNALVLQESKTEVARYKDNNNIWHTFTNLQEAINDAAALNVKVDILLVQYLNDANPDLNNNIIDIKETIIIPEGANITFGSVVKHTDASGSDFKYETPSSPTILKRGDNLTGELICVQQGGSLEIGGNTVSDVNDKETGDQPSLGKIIIDGGANFGGNYGIPVVTDDGKGGAGTANTNNTAITAHAPLIVNNGKLLVKEGAFLQNNDNNYAKPGEGFGSHNYGGGIRNQGSGELVMSGGSITNCYSREGGAIININRPEKDGYVENGNPSVKIQGGSIENNASQMKGAAVQTIYGGANTEILGGVIQNNVSLHDLGTVTVEEGGSVKISGGTLTAGSTNENAIYIYNKYSLADYKNAVTKPFIEGKAPAKISITNAPTINGKVHLDNSCYVVDTTNEPWGESTKYYETFIDISGYTGSTIEVDINQDRPYGQTAVSTTDNFEKLNITYPTKDKDYSVGERFGYTTQKEGIYALNYGGYDINIGQSEANKIDISGVCDKNIEKISIVIGDKTFVLTVTDGVINQTIDLAEFNLSQLDLKVIIDYTNDLTAKESTFTNAVKVILYNKDSGVITVPNNTVFVDKNGQKQSVSSGTLPNEVKIDEEGYATFFIGDEERKILVGTRENTPDPTDELIKGEVKDFDDVTITIIGAVGYEYNLLKDGVLINDTWRNVSNDEDTIIFSGLDRGTNYQVVVRKIDTDQIKIPSEYVILPEEDITTLTEDEKNKKVDFEESYELIKDTLYDGIETPKATSEGIQAVINKYEELTDEVKKLVHIDEYKKHLDEGYANVRAAEWKKTHEEILTKETTSLVLVDKALTDKAIEEYESLNEATKELLTEEFENVLLKKKKLLAAKEIDKALKNDSTNNEECQKIAKDYIDMINDPEIKGLEEMNILIEKAKASLEIQTEYDKIIKENATDMTDESLIELKKILDEKLDAILNTTKETLEEVKTNAIFDLKMEEAKGLIEKRFDIISEESTINGITNESILEIKKIKNDKLTDLIENSLTLEDIKTKLDNTLNILDKEEGKAILKDYLKSDDAQDIKDIVLGENGSNKAIDALTPDKISDIEKIVVDTKLKIEKERAKDAINQYLTEHTTNNGNGISQDYIKDNGIIDNALNATDIWDLVDIAKTKIWLEEVRKDTLAKIIDNQNKNKKTEGINKVIDDAIVVSDDLTNITDLEELKEKAKVDALNVIITIDREQFKADHRVILDKSISAISESDLTAIDNALDDLKDNYIIESQDAMDDYRNDLLNKKKAAITNLLDSQKDGSSVDTIVDQFVEVINNLDINGNTASDIAVNELLDKNKKWAIDAIAFEKYKNEKIEYLESDKKESDSKDTLDIIDDGKESIKNIDFDTNRPLDEQKVEIDEMLAEIDADILLQRQKDKAKAELEDCYKIITGKDDLTVELVTNAKEAIDNATSIDNINNALGENIKSIVDSIIREKDSDTTKQIAIDLKPLIDNVITNANANKVVASVVDTVKDYNKAVDDQRQTEKAEAKKEIDDIVKDIFGENPLTKEVIDLIEFEKKEIDKADYADYPLIIDKTKNKLEVIDYHDKIVDKAIEDGFKGFEDLKEVKDNAIADMEKSANKVEIENIKKDALDKLEREVAIVDIKNYINEEESQFVKDAVKRGEEQIDALSKPATNEKLAEIIIETKKTVDAERFKDKNPIVREDFTKIDEKDIGAIAKALEDLKIVDANVVKERLDKEAIQNGYTNYQKQLEDIVNKADFESEKTKTEDALKALVRDHDGEKVRDILKEELDKIKAEINYEQNFNDADRDGYKDDLKEKLEEAYEKAKIKIEHSQLQQRTENQIIEDVEDRVDSAKYNDAQKEEIEEILDKAKEEIAKIPHGNTEEEKAEAKAKIDKILEDAKKELIQVKVVAVSTGDIKPNKDPIKNDGTGDYTKKDNDEFWGIVSNDLGMDGAIKLVIDKTDNDAKKTIKKAVKNDKLVLAEGSQIEGSLTALVEKKEVKTALDIYLLKDSTKITEFEGKYTVKVLLTLEMRSMVGLQVVYINDDGTVEVFKTVLEDNKYLVFTTTHFSEFFVLGLPEYNLWWLIITLSVIVLAEIIYIAIVLLKKKKEETQNTEKNAESKVNANAMLPFLGAVIVPTPAIAVCIILGVVAIGLGFVIAYLLKRKNKVGANSEESLNKVKENQLIDEMVCSEDENSPEIVTVTHLNKFASTTKDKKQPSKDKKVIEKNKTAKSNAKEKSSDFTKDKVRPTKVKIEKEVIIPKNNPFYKVNLKKNDEEKVADTFEVVSEVAAADVNKLMSDKVANDLLIKKTKDSDKTKVGIVNISLLNEYFKDGETVTLEEINNRIPQFDKKITYLKVLASGSLNKKLNVEADSFSLDAIKMISLVGGSAIKFGK